MTFETLTSELAKINQKMKKLNNSFGNRNDYLSGARVLKALSTDRFELLKSKKQGIILGAKIIIENEIKFLFGMRTQLDSPDFDNNDAGLTREDIDKEIADLKELDKEIGEWLNYSTNNY